jgi:Sulfotransferase family
MGTQFFHKLRLLASGEAWAVISRMCPPPGAETELGQLLWTTPRPLIHPGSEMMVVFSQKSACTNVVIWFLHHLGHMKVARDFHQWPHAYRCEVYYQSDLYRNAYDLDLTKFKLIRIVRDPYERAVSSFRHVLRFDEIAGPLRYRSMVERGLSFAAFLDFLEKTNLSNCDPHFCIQRHPIEDKLPVQHLINVSKEDLFKRLNEVEVDLGLPQTNLSWCDDIRWHNRPEQRHLPDDSDFYTRRFTRDEAQNGPWPSCDAFLSPEARERIGRLYATDIRAYFS